MNIKTLRKNYTVLSKRERLILYDSAENRNDKGEMDAVLNACPKQDWQMLDIGIGLEKLLVFRLFNLVEQLKLSRDAFFWLFICPESEISLNFARSIAYHHCLNQDVIEAIYQEIGLDNEGWKEKQNEMFNLGAIDEYIDEFMQEIAFDDENMSEYVRGLINPNLKDCENIRIDSDADFKERLERCKQTIKNSPMKFLFED